MWDALLKVRKVLLTPKVIHENQTLKAQTKKKRNDMILNLFHLVFLSKKNSSYTRGRLTEGRFGDLEIMFLADHGDFVFNLTATVTV